MTKAPCQECNIHSDICHAICPAFKEYERIHKEELLAIHKAKHKFNLGFGARWRSEKELKQENVERRRRKAKVFKQTMK